VHADPPLRRPATTSAPDDPESRAAVWWPLLIALVPFAVLAAIHWSWTPPPGYGDHAQYLAHARALIEGRSYTDIGYIYHPAAPMLGPRAYPPGLPLTLAPIVAAFGVDSVWNHVLMIVSVVLIAVFAYRRLLGVMAPWQAALAVGLATLAIEVRFGTIVPLSDPGFCALLWALIWVVDRTTRWTWPRIALVTALGLAAMSYRIPGVVVVPALALYALAGWRSGRRRALIPVALWGLLGLAALASGAVDIPFRAYLIPQPGEIADRFTSMARVYRAALFDLQLYPFGDARLNKAYHALATLLTLGGTAALLWRHRRSMLSATVLMYVAMLLASPVSDGRYLWPLYPAIAAGLVLGATAAARLVLRPITRTPRHAAAVAFALGAVMLLAAWREGRVPAPPPSLEVRPDARAMFAWLREQHARQPMRIMFYNPRVLALETRIPTMGAIAGPPAAQLGAIREREISHIIWQLVETETCRARLLNALPRVYPDRFASEFENATFRVYRVLDAEPPVNETHELTRITPEICQSLPPG
jgi:hypothetical protein